jgi:hypothetical protein
VAFDIGACGRNHARPCERGVAPCRPEHVPWARTLGFRSGPQLWPRESVTTARKASLSEPPAQGPLPAAFLRQFAAQRRCKGASACDWEGRGGGVAVRWSRRVRIERCGRALHAPRRASSTPVYYSSEQSAARPVQCCCVRLMRYSPGERRRENFGASHLAFAVRASLRNSYPRGRLPNGLNTGSARPFGMHPRMASPSGRVARAVHGRDFFRDRVGFRRLDAFGVTAKTTRFGASLKGPQRLT